MTPTTTATATATATAEPITAAPTAAPPTAASPTAAPPITASPTAAPPTAGEMLGPRCREADPDGLLREMLTIIGDKWTVLVIGHLQEGPLRFSRIMEHLPAISHRMLTRTLRTLERDGIVSRTVFPESPPRVEYALTPLGHTLIEPLAGLQRWVLSHRDEILERREQGAA